MQPCSEATQGNGLKFRVIFFFFFFFPFIFEARKSDWVFGLEEKTIEKNGLGKNKELAGWVRKVPPA